MTFAEVLVVLAIITVVAGMVTFAVFLLLWIIDHFGWMLPDPFDALVVNLSLPSLSRV